MKESRENILSHTASLFVYTMISMGDCKLLLQEKTCFQNKSKLNTEDYFVQHMNITMNKVKLNGKLYAKDN